MTTKKWPRPVRVLTIAFVALACWTLLFGIGALIGVCINGY